MKLEVVKNNVILINTSNENEQEVSDGQDNHGTLCLSVLGGFKEGFFCNLIFRIEFELDYTVYMRTHSKNFYSMQ